jgi:hypothetical protein
MRALPYQYRDQKAETGTYVRINVSGDCGGSWYLSRDDDRWRLIESPRGRQLAEVTIPQEIAWRIFTKGIDRDGANAETTVSGDRVLGLHVLRMVSIIG